MAAVVGAVLVLVGWVLWFVRWRTVETMRERER